MINVPINCSTRVKELQESAPNLALVLHEVDSELLEYLGDLKTINTNKGYTSFLPLCQVSIGMTTVYAFAKKDCHTLIEIYLTLGDENPNKIKEWNSW